MRDATSKEQGLHATGNWTDFWQDDNGDGTWNLKQQRDHNKVNEIDVDETHGDGDNPITETTGTAWADPVYDANGNMTGVPRPGDLANGYTCKYDAWNRLVEVKEGETVVASHEYDGLNRRTIEAFLQQSVTTYYLHKFYNASWQMLELRVTPTANAQPESLGVFGQYVWSARYIDALVLREYAFSLHYFLGDANFNVTTLVNTSGDAREHYQYDPYGNVTVLNGAASDADGAEWTADPNNTSDVANHHLYTGRRLDHRTGFYHYRNRYYHAQLGRFISRDPIGYDGGDVNLYRYVANRPTTFLDPRGTTIIMPAPPRRPFGKPLPRLRPGTILGPLNNVAYNWFTRPRGHFNIPYTDKPMMIRSSGQVFPTTVKLALPGVGTQGKHKWAGRPLAKNTYFGVSGALPCIGLVVVCPCQVAAFHFSVLDNARATLAKYSWPRTCNAVICGGNNQTWSNAQMENVIGELQYHRIHLKGIVNKDGCYFGETPWGWYVGSNTMVSQDQSQEE